MAAALGIVRVAEKRLAAVHSVAGKRQKLFLTPQKGRFNIISI